MRAAKLNSSMISRIAYDDEAQELSVWFRESCRYVYYGVPREVYDALRTSPSAGRYFTSDTHFGDHRTLNLYKRPFASVAEMDAHMMAQWNGVVAPDDEIWHLGDFARKLSDVPSLLERLNGRKHLLLGNNDPPAIARLPGWESVSDYREIELGGRKLVLCHYAFRSWNGQHRGAVNLHGHSHGRMKPLLRQFDVGADPRGFCPVTLDQLLARRA